jgi:dTDP-4-dehydrorhamnose reductase
MQKVLIIGAKGMLGQELVLLFKNDRDYKVTAWDFEQIDITDEIQTKEKITKLAPSIIINATGYNAVDLCEKDKAEFEKAKKINGKAPGYLSKIAKKLDSTLVNYSTDYVFSGMPELPEPTGCGGSCNSCNLHEGFVPQIGFDEDAIPQPVQKYGKSKLMGEIAVQKYGKKYYIIRPSKIFGKPAKAKNAKKSFFDVMLAVGKKNTEVKVVDEETSCFTYAPDLAKKTKEIIEANKPFGIYHVTNEGACTWYEAVVELYRMAKIKTKVIPVSGDEFPRPAQRPYVSTLINTRLNPMRNYKLALREYLKNTK